jgi:CRP/FNR family cyclic AMP-dependent transcriptional regulator
METVHLPADPGFLRTVPIFGGLEDAELERLWSYTEVQRHGPGETILHQGDLAKEMFVLLDGEVEIFAGDGAEAQILGRLKRGDCFGEMAIIDIQPRSASVRAVTPVSLMVIGFDDLIRVYQFNMQTYTIIVLNIAREISRRLRRANERLAAAGLHEPSGP